MKHKLYVVGIGPGDAQHMTPAARSAIEGSEVVVGYKTYLGLIEELLGEKEVVSSGMKREIDRCREALKIAAAGRTVALVSSGDAGIYGMAGLVLELLEEQPVEVEIVPGVSAVQAAASRLGAPLMHDFAVISLSDLMTPWSLIRSRIDAAGRADFVIALYNPRSKGRTTQIVEARQILLRHRAGETPVGIVRNACRKDENIIITDLQGLADHLEQIDMLSLVMIGNSQTRFKNGKMVTPRGYVEKYLDKAQEKGKRSKEKGEAFKHLDPLTFNLEPAPARALFIGGTGSDVGKSVLTAGICRVLRRRGLAVAPFKAQNMALNSAVTPEGGEIGRAQALQAAACGLAPHTDMNPVLLKPNSDTGSQVIVSGRPVGNMSVIEYHRFKGQAFAEVRQAFGRLAKRHELMVMEGAGSIAEINLKAHDITNLRAAAMAQAPVVLVADIDRGGVFASIVGTLEVLDPAERAQVAAVVINKFRGDPALLRPGIEAVEDRCGIPVLGVVPWIDLQLPEEDSVALGRKGSSRGEALVRIGVVRLPRISNYTDFDPLEQEPAVELAYIERPEQVETCDLLILPGTKSTLADLGWLRSRGLDQAIVAHHEAGRAVIGICGGFQMLGQSVADPLGVESEAALAQGLGLLDVTTVMDAEKQTHQVEAHALDGAPKPLAGVASLSGYEIHMGRSECGAGARPLLNITRRSGRQVDLTDGAVSADGRVWGTYLHGLFDNPDLRRSLIEQLAGGDERAAFHLQSPSSLEDELDRLADHLEQHIDFKRLMTIAGLAHGKDDHGIAGSLRLCP